MDFNWVRLLLLLTGVTVAMYLTVLVLSLSGVDFSDDTMKIMSEVLPAWMQGVGTVGAVLVAMIVYRDWRKQERLKAMAQQAPELGREIMSLVREIFRARGTHKLLPDGGELEFCRQYSTEARAKAIEECKKKIEGLSIKRPVLGDPELRADLREFLNTTRAMTRGIERIRWLYERPPIGALGPKQAKEVRRLLIEMGHYPTLVDDKAPDDVLAVQAKPVLDRIRKTLLFED